MRYALICLDKPNALQTRVENRADVAAASNAARWRCTSRARATRSATAAVWPSPVP